MESIKSTAKLIFKVFYYTTVVALLIVPAILSGISLGAYYWLWKIKVVR